MKYSDILKIDIEDISKMSRSELAKTVKTLGDVANKRLNRAMTKTDISPAVKSLLNSGGKVKTGGKTRNQLLSEYKRVSQFLQNKTSTQIGYRRVKKEFEARIGGSITPEQTKSLWGVYNKITSLDPNFSAKYGSTQLQSDIRDEIIAGKMDDDILKNALDKLQSFYDDNTGGGLDVSEFFDMGASE